MEHIRNFHEQRISQPRCHGHICPRQLQPGTMPGTVGRGRGRAWSLPERLRSRRAGSIAPGRGNTASLLRTGHWTRQIPTPTSLRKGRVGYECWGVSQNPRSNRNQERECCRTSPQRSALPLLCDKSSRPGFPSLCGAAKGFSAWAVTALAAPRERNLTPSSESRIPREGISGSLQSPWSNQLCPGDRITAHQQSSHDDHEAGGGAVPGTGAGEVPCKPRVVLCSQNQETGTKRRSEKDSKDLTLGAGQSQRAAWRVALGSSIEGQPCMKEDRMR